MGAPGTDLLHDKCTRLHTQAQVRWLGMPAVVFSTRDLLAIRHESAAVHSPADVNIYTVLVSRTCTWDDFIAGAIHAYHRIGEPGQGDGAEANRIRGCHNQASGALGPALRRSRAAGTASCE